MSLDDLKARIPVHAKDTKINLGNWLSLEQYAGLTDKQMFGIALACSESLKSKPLVDFVLSAGAEALSDADVLAARSAASIMAMNNVYYKALHLIDDAEIARMPAKLRMTVIGSPGVDKSDFELYCLAVSAINGCGMCLKAHAQELAKRGAPKEAVHSALRIAAVANASAFAIA